MEKIFPQDSLFLMSNLYLSIADVAFLPELDMLEVSGHSEELLRPRPKLNRWYLAMKQQEDWQRVLSIPVLENGGPFPVSVTADTSPFPSSFASPIPPPLTVVDLPEKEVCPKPSEASIET